MIERKEFNNVFELALTSTITNWTLFNVYLIIVVTLQPYLHTTLKLVIKIIVTVH